MIDTLVLLQMSRQLIPASEVEVLPVALRQRSEDQPVALVVP